jgi:hypothetical protein
MAARQEARHNFRFVSSNSMVHLDRAAMALRSGFGLDELLGRSGSQRNDGVLHFWPSVSVKDFAMDFVRPRIIATVVASNPQLQIGQHGVLLLH